MNLLSDIPSRLAMSCPFAGGENATKTLPDLVTGDTVNYVDGFPAKYGAPSSLGGKYVSRGEMNGIANSIQRDGFFSRCGGINSFDADFAVQIGGYPKGAVLQIVNSGALWFVESIVPNNKIDFTGTTPTTAQYNQGIRAGSVDGVNWRYCYESKYIQQEEALLAHVEESNLLLTDTSSSNIYARECPSSGIATIRNFKYSIGEQATTAGGLHAAGTFIGSGIIMRTIARSSGSTLVPLYASANNALPWTCARLIQTGAYSTSQLSALVSYYNPGNQAQLKYTVTDGLLAVSQGDILVIDYINSYFQVNPSISSSNIWYPISFSFDIYII